MPATTKQADDASDQPSRFSTTVSAVVVVAASVSPVVVVAGSVSPVVIVAASVSAVVIVAASMTAVASAVSHVVSRSLARSQRQRALSIPESDEDSPHLITLS